MSEYVYVGLTSQTVDIMIHDSSSTTGAGLAGLVYNSASLVASYRKGATGSRTAITLATQTVGGAYSSGGFVEIDATNMKGVYRLDLPNASVDTEGFVSLYLSGATNMVPVALRIDCRPLPADVKKLLGTAWLTPGTAGTPDVNTKLVGGQTASAAGTVTFPGTIASTTNITAGTITTVTTTTTATNVTTVNGLAAGIITAASIAADAITDAKVASDVTIASVTGSVGSVVGLTASNLDTTVSSRMATYTQPTGFLSAVFPSDPADASDIAASFVTIASSIGTLSGKIGTPVSSVSADIAAVKADLLIASNMTGYCLSALVGACSDAGTAAETYAVTFSTSTYTIDHTGLDATGNRGTAVLTKT